MKKSHSLILLLTLLLQTACTKMNVPTPTDTNPPDIDPQYEMTTGYNRDYSHPPVKKELQTNEEDDEEDNNKPSDKE